MSGHKRLPSREWLMEENQRLSKLVEAANTEASRTDDRGKVLSVNIQSSSFPPSLIITAPGMDEKRIAAYVYDFYALIFATYADIAKVNAKAIKSARKIYLEAAGVVEAYGHSPCAAELKRRSEQYPACPVFRTDSDAVLEGIKAVADKVSSTPTE